MSNLIATTDLNALRPDSVLASKFKPGDKVRVYFIDFKSPCDGKVATVLSVVDGYVRVDFRDGRTPTNLYPQRLSLIESMATITTDTTETKSLFVSDFKPGDRVQVNYGYGWDGPGIVTFVGRFVNVQLDHKPIGFHGGFSPKYLTKINSPVSEIIPATGSHLPQRAYAVATMLAIKLAKKHGMTNIDQVQEALEKQGFTSSQLGNAAGMIFRSKNWTKIGAIKSTRLGNHGRTISVWKYTGV